MRRAVGMNRDANHQHARRPRIDKRTDGGKARVDAGPSMVVNGCAARVIVFAYGHADPAGSEIKGEHGGFSGAALFAAGSRVPDVFGQLREVDSQQLHRGRQTPLRGKVEDHIRVGRHREPSIGGKLLLQLPGAPARVAQ